MKFDRNTVLGFLLLAALFIGYFVFTSQQQKEYQKTQAETQRIADSTRLANIPKSDTSANRKRDSLATVTDTAKRDIQAGGFTAASKGEEKLVIVENSVLRAAFTNKGGRTKWVELKGYTTADSNLVRLAGTDFDKLGYAVNAGDGIVQTSDLYFDQGTVVTNADSSTTVTFVVQSGDSAGGSSITHQFKVKKGEYMIDFGIKLKGANKLFTGGAMNLNWQYAAAQQEVSHQYERENTQVGYVLDGDFDYHTIDKTNDKVFDAKTKWVGVRQRFFYTILVAKNDFTSGKMEWTVPDNDSNVIVRSVTNMKVDVPLASEADLDFNIYYGPSDYHLLKKYDMKFEKLVNLGQGMYAFVRPLNRFVILPIFDFIRGFIGNYGIVIALLTLFIRLLISPLTYSSYLSGAKMKALRPEIATLKAKHGGDQQAMSMEQMKLFREAGVNPLGGCIPALLQIPIFFALFSFFNSEVGLRGASFLWSSDLSAPDRVIEFGTSIPLLGDHLSIFNITAVVTSFLISIYSMSMSPDQSNPVMKYLPYIFPVFLLFFFNRLPSGLTWYYTVSNLITLLLQFIIQNYIIDHKKVLAKIELNRKKPKTKSKWQERMELMQEQQKKLKESQARGRR